MVSNCRTSLCSCYFTLISIVRGFGFEERLQHLYWNLLKEGDYCIDIGAYTGRHTIPMACKVEPMGHVEAFEPNPESASQLRNRLAFLKLTMLIFVNVLLPTNLEKPLLTWPSIFLKNRELRKGKYIMGLLI